MMKMKRTIAMALTLLLMTALVLPQTALAATRYYLDVSITDGTDTVSGESGYLTPGSDSLTGAVVEVINEKYNSGALKVFGSAAMQNIMAEGLAAQKAGKTEWANWVAAYQSDPSIVNANQKAADVDLKAKLADLDTKVSALSEDTDYQLSYTPDGKAAPSTDGANGKTYTVTIALKSYTTGGGSSGSTVKPANTITVKNSANGSATADRSTATANEKVTISTKPDTGYVVSRILVTDKNGNELSTSYAGDGKYTFTMPDSSVTVTPVFRKATLTPEDTGVSSLLNANDHVAFMIGNDKGEFRPTDAVTRAEVAQIFYRLLKDQNVTATKSFSDVADTAWYKTAVETLATLGIIQGTGEDTYEPTRAITRAEFTAICARFAKAASGSVRFSDVPESFWAFDYITTAAEYGWIVGDGTGKFNPNAQITRAEAAAIVNRMLQRLGDFEAIDAGNAKTFPDVSESFWGYYDIAEATSGHDHAFDSEGLHEDWK